MSKDTLRALTDFLHENDSKFELFEHEPYKTSHDATRITGIDPSHAAKSLLYRTVGGFVLAVLPASERVSSGKLRRASGSKDVRMASSEDLWKVMGCEIGVCHPIGRIASVRTLVDLSLAQATSIGFSTGSPRHTITMDYDEYIRVALPDRVDIRSE